MDNTIVWAVMGAGFFMIILSIISQMRSDIARINLTLHKVAKQVGVPDTITNELQSLISAGKKVEAIKKYRMVTGLGLKEAKEYVDFLGEQEST